MRERNEDTGLVNEIDTFLIRFTFPPGAQNQEYLGERQAATVTLSADITCVEPEVCGPFPSPSELPSGKTTRPILVQEWSKAQQNGVKELLTRKEMRNSVLIASGTTPTVFWYILLPAGAGPAK